MIMKRIISTFLAVLMLVGSLTIVAGAKKEEKAPEYQYNTGKLNPTMDYMTGAVLDENGEATEEIVDTKEEKLALMDLRLEQYGYRLYVDAYSGEVAIENVATGDVLFTNPYDVSADSSMQETKKQQMLSQFIIHYADISKGDTLKVYSSYADAVRGGNDGAGASQLDVKHIKNGIRVEYSIGRVDSRYLIPEVISKEKFITEIREVARAAGASIPEMGLLDDEVFFDPIDIEAEALKFNDPIKQQEKRDTLLKLHPYAANGPVYVFKGEANTKERKSVEAIIKKYCPDFTFEDIDEEYLELGYDVHESDTQSYEALFRISLEYTIDQGGLSVRVPANGIRFDETLFRIESIEVLPYMGAGKNTNSGYTFFPDGSGALFDFKQLAALKTETYFHGTIYGEDFALYNIGTSSPHNEAVRYPVYGLVEDEVDENGKESTRGYVAIIEEGDSMTRLSAYHSLRYNTVVTKINPRPYDQYDLSDSLSVGVSGSFKVVSPRKYTGDFRIRYVMLSDSDEFYGKGYYEASYVGMAKAYRDYLEANNVLTRLTKKDVREDIPLYIETFGAIETTEKFMSIPYDAMRALTSFEDIRTMYQELSKNDVENINFIMTGYSNGGMTTDQVPYKLNWDNSVEKELDFEDLLAYAKEENFGLYPDFDFVFAADNKMFDGLSLMSHAVRTIDDRYSSKREYSATRQTYVNYFELAISPAYFSRFYEKLTEDYAEYDPIGISVSTMGDYLNSDFDEDEPYNREESKGLVEDAFRYFDKHYNRVLTSGGNAYTWKYVDYITDVSIDSSRHARSAATVPFLGIVLHGYVQTAGSAINMEGNIDYAILRAIENGASLKFVLSYKNTQLLKKNDSTSIYYSVRYDIWLDELIARYKEINEALHDVQTSTIEVHKFIDGQRIPNAEEILQDANSELMNSIQQEVENAATNKEALRVVLQTVRKNLLDWDKYVVADNENSAIALNEIKAEKLEALKDAAAALAKADESVKLAEEAVTALEEALAATPAPVEENTEAVEGEEAEPTPQDLLAKAKEALTKAQEKQTEALEAMKDAYSAYTKAADKVAKVAAEYIEKYEFARANFAKLTEEGAYTKAIIAKLQTILDDVADDYDTLVAFAKNLNETPKDETVAELEEKYAEYLGIGAVADEEVKDEVKTEQFNKYAVATNSIVYERYSNGKAFILNFNNYAVKVKYAGVSYTIDAYGYIVIS